MPISIIPTSTNLRKRPKSKLEIVELMEDVDAKIGWKKKKINTERDETRTHSGRSVSEGANTHSWKFYAEIVSIPRLVK